MSAGERHRKVESRLRFLFGGQQFLDNAKSQTQRELATESYESLENRSG
jgi:hypothetical protein